jgi:P27 family predicted phage terminase small subunit
VKGRKPIVQAVSNALTRCPKVPGWLSAYAAAEWKRVGKDLVARRILTEDNLSLLESYTIAVGMVRESSETIAAQGATIATEKGVVRHPAVQTLKEMMGESRRLASELGLTPTSRNKIGSPPEENDDELADMGV